MQFYPDNPNAPLLDFVAGAGAMADPILPYAYASGAEEARVLEAMAAGQVDHVVFTCKPQVERLVALAEALSRARIAAVGPVVAAAAEAAGGARWR